MLKKSNQASNVTTACLSTRINGCFRLVPNDIYISHEMLLISQTFVNPHDDLT